jgi:tRNA A-37 threonylcarbamoyl transferase component Bud32/tetratricopeptide (TPR) repeat protein
MSRFETLQTLGAGAFGQVSLVRERSTGQRLAMKVAHPYAQAQITARMRREYRALSKIQHQNVVRVYEFGETEDGRPFITLEYVEGSTLEVWLYHKPSQTQILEVFLALADALGAVHQAGLLHRDLKPDNVMVTQAGVVKLMDFGLTKLHDDSLQLTKAGAMLGTALYMSPEQAKGMTLDLRSDWYAYGVMLYRAVCGILPFRGQSLVEVVMAHLNQPPTPPKDHNPEVGATLNNLILSLLEKSPNQRPSSTTVVRQKLLAALEQPLEPVVSMPRADLLLQVPLLGRERELLALQQATQTGGLVLLYGTAGIGKTALVSALRQDAPVWVQAGGIAEEVAPFGIVSRLIEALHKQDLLHTASAEQRSIWQKLAPRVDLEASADTLSADPALGKLQLLEGFLQLLVHCQEVLFLLEDLHLADDASLELLRYALPLLPEVRLLATYRKEELKKLLPNAKLSLELSPLPAPMMLQLVQGWLGAPVEVALGEELLRGTGGNPWFLRERLSSMIQDGNIVQRLGVFEWTRSVVYMPESVAMLLEKRVQNLKTRTLEFAQAGSIFGQQFEFAGTMYLLEWSEEDCFDALEDLLKVQLIAEHQADTFSFTHPSFADALGSKILGIKARLWHRRAAAWLEAVAKQDSLALAKHYFLGGEAQKAVPLALDNAEACLLRFAYPQAEVAFRLAQQALKVAPNIQQELHLQRGLAQTLYALGHVQEALLLWESALLNNALEASGELQIRLALAAARTAQGNYVTALQVLEGLEDPYTWLERADCYQRSGQNDLARYFGLKALHTFQAQQNPSGQSRALTILSWADFDTNQHPQGLVLAQEAVECAKDHAYLQMLAYQVQSAHQYRLRDFGAVKKIYNIVLALPVTRTQLQHQVWFDMGMANLLLFEDQLPQAETMYQRVYANAKRAESHDQELRSAFSLVLLHHMQNQFPRALDHLETIAHPAIQELWRCRLALADGSQIAKPPELDNLPAWTHGLQRITHLEWLLASQQFAPALAQCANPDDEYQWFWCLGKLHAEWEMGLDYTQSLAALGLPMKDSGLAHAKREAWMHLIQVALEKEPMALESLQNSAIGVFARAVLARV